MICGFLCLFYAVTDTEEYECASVLSAHVQDVKQVRWHPTKELLASCSYDDTIKVNTMEVTGEQFWGISYCVIMLAEKCCTKCFLCVTTISKHWQFLLWFVSSGYPFSPFPIQASAIARGLSSLPNSQRLFCC